MEERNFKRSKLLGIPVMVWVLFSCTMLGGMAIVNYVGSDAQVNFSVSPAEGINIYFSADQTEEKVWSTNLDFGPVVGGTTQKFYTKFCNTANTEITAPLVITLYCDTGFTWLDEDTQADILDLYCADGMTYHAFDLAKTKINDNTLLLTLPAVPIPAEFSITLPCFITFNAGASGSYQISVEAI